MSEDRFGHLLGAYLLGELSRQEEHELERHLDECPECLHELDQIRRTHELLRQVAANEPPPEVKDRVLAQVGDRIPARPLSRWGLWIPTAAALVVAAVLGVGVFRTITGDSASAVPLRATAAAPEAGGEVRAEMVGENLRVDLKVWGMPELAEDEYYEMWYYADDGGRISCGTFRAEGRETVNLSAPATAGEYPEIEITREPDNGDPRANGETVLEGRFRNS